MTVADFFTSARFTLQDLTGRRWTDAELLHYVNEGMRDIALRTFFNRVEETLSVVSATTIYTTTYTPIKILSVESSQQFQVTSNNEITFTNPRDENVIIVYYAYPQTVTTDIVEDVDIIDALRFFVLSRAYEKEDSPENFNKASYFRNKYIDTLNQNALRWHGDTGVYLAKSDFLD